MEAGILDPGEQQQQAEHGLDVDGDEKQRIDVESHRPQPLKDARRSYPSLLSFLALHGKQLVKGPGRSPPLRSYGFFTVSGDRMGLTKGNCRRSEHDFLQKCAVLSPDGRSTTFRDLETGENPCKSATVSLRPSATRR